MRKPLILIEDKIPFIKDRLEPIADIRYISPDKFTPESVSRADAMIVRTRTKCDKDLLQNSNVKFIATATIGTDHIDTQWCNQNQITVCNAPGCNAPAVAQYVWAAILRHGINPANITIGIVGYGNVGSIVAEWGRALGANILICDPPRAKVDKSFTNTPLHSLIANSDIITLHTPLTKDGPHPTFHLIDRQMLNLCPEKCIIINAARGAIIDNNALTQHCLHHQCTTFIDCWENEPNIDCQLLNLAAIATPHIAGYSLQGKQRATRMVVEATIQYLKDHNMINPADIHNIDLNDLPQPYQHNSIQHIDSDTLRNRIIQSYNPLIDTQSLKLSLQKFSTHSTQHIPTSAQNCAATQHTSTKAEINATHHTSTKAEINATHHASTKAEIFESLRANYNYRPEPTL